MTLRALSGPRGLADGNALSGLRSGAWEVRDVYVFTRDTVIPADVVLHVLRGALLRPMAGVTVTINGPVTVGPFRWLDTSAGGTVVFGSGAVQDVLAEWWGAVGNDLTTDYSGYIREALAAATAARKPLRLLDHYRVDSTIVCEDNAHIVGSGRHVSGFYWYGAAAGGACVQVGAAADGSGETTTAVTLADFRLYIPDAAAAGGIALDVRSGKWSCSYERLNIGHNSLRAFDIGIRLCSYTFTNRIVGCNVERCVRGVEIHSRANTNWLAFCTINNNTTIGIAIDGAAGSPGGVNNIVLLGCEIEWNTTYGLYCNAARNVNVTGCRFEANNRDGAASLGAQVYVTNSSALLTSCQFSGNWDGVNGSYIGVYAFGSDYVVLVQCVESSAHRDAFAQGNTSANQVRLHMCDFSTAPHGSTTLVIQDLGRYEAATTPGAVVGKMRVYHQDGTLRGWVPVYDAIT